MNDYYFFLIINNFLLFFIFYLWGYEFVDPKPCFTCLTHGTGPTITYQKMFATDFLQHVIATTSYQQLLEPFSDQWRLWPIPTGFIYNCFCDHHPSTAFATGALLYLRQVYYQLCLRSVSYKYWVQVSLPISGWTKF